MVVEAEGLAVSFAQGWQGRSRTLFQGVDLAIDEGQLVGLVGPSGSGKTTLGDVLLGLHRPDEGRVKWNGVELYGPTGNSIRRLRPRYQKIYQDPISSFYPRRTMAQALLDVIRYHGLADDRARAEEMLRSAASRMGLGEEHLKRFPHQLSGGEVQRLALARVLLLQPRFIVADEPTSRVDISVQAHVIRLIAEVVEQERLAVLLISHDLELVKRVCDRVLAWQPGNGKNGPNRLVEFESRRPPVIDSCRRPGAHHFGILT